MADNTSQSPVVDLSGDGGILKQLLREGSGEKPPNGANIKVHYVGTLEDGSKFDSSRDRGDFFRFRIGKGMVIKGWDEGVKTMSKGELAILTCRQDYAYGEAGSPPTIPPKATLKFEVELFDWDDPEPETIPEKIKVANKRKEEGNAKFKDGKYSEAAQLYSSSLEFFEKSWGISDEERKQVDAIKLPCLLNLAACQIKTKDYSDAAMNCSKALDLETNNVKALYRRGQAYSLNGDFDKAKADLNEAATLAPSNKEVRQEMEQLKKNIAAYKQKQKQMFAGIFEKAAKPTTPQPEEKKDTGS